MDEQSSQAEIAALKARLSALEGGSSATHQAPPKPKPGCLNAFLIALAGLVILIFASNPLRDGDPSEAPSAKVTPVCNKPWAAEVVATAQRTRLISGIDMEPSQGVIVVVRRGPWEFLSLNQQKVVAAAIDCHIAGPDYLKAINFRLSRDGPNLYRLTYTDLYELRAAGAAAG